MAVWKGCRSKLLHACCGREIWGRLWSTACGGTWRGFHAHTVDSGQHPTLFKHEKLERCDMECQGAVDGWGVSFSEALNRHRYHASLWHHISGCRCLCIPPKASWQQAASPLCVPRRQIVVCWKSSITLRVPSGLVHNMTSGSAQWQSQEMTVRIPTERVCSLWANGFWLFYGHLHVISHWNIWCLSPFFFKCCIVCFLQIQTKFYISSIEL